MFERWLGGKQTEEARLQELSAQIQAFPDAAANYVLRAELFAERGHHALARADYQTALALCEQDLGTVRWGMVTQVLRDRALLGVAQLPAESQALPDVPAPLAQSESEAPTAQTADDMPHSHPQANSAPDIGADGELTPMGEAAAVAEEVHDTSER